MNTKRFRIHFPKASVLAYFAVFIYGCMPPSAAGADQYFDYGLKMFQARNYKVAAQYFDVRLKSNPNDSYAQYYRGLCYHVGGNLDDAKNLYQSVIANGSDANIKALAQKQLSIIERVQGAAAAFSPSVKGSSTTANIPSGNSRPGDDDDDNRVLPTVVPPNAKAYFTITPGHNDMNVDGAVNKRRMTFCFDTGASVPMLGKNHLRELGIHPPTTPATSKVGGIGGTVESWTMKLDVTIGGITKKIPVTVTEEWDHAPLLGQDFFSDIDYEIDNIGHCIHFSKSSAIAKDDTYSIPFQRIGKHLYVQLEGEKGKKTQMIVDTGAEGILFSPSNVRELGLDTTGGETEYHKGVGGSGTTEAVGFVVDMLRLGPIVVRNVKCSADVGGKGMIGKEGAAGLLGQAFFSGWRFTIDNRNQRLRFFH
ncbi:MAG TPA: aspartyl protease family protein [Candidatus Melainabacteria bacterium]|nr:aspartyl protease family protein [Candidatus Melainabacteria bacterium]